MELSEILESVDIVSLIEQYVELEEKNGEFWGRSPFKEEKTPSFSARRETGRFYDFSSGIGGNAVTFLKYYHGVTAHEAVEMLKKFAGITDEGYVAHQKMSATSVCKKYAKPKIVVKQNTSNVLADNYMDRYEDKPEKYEIWRAEGISDESMAYFGVKYDGFSNCIVYPVRNDVGKIVNIGGRTLYPDFKERCLRKYTYFKPWNGQMNIIYGLFENKESILEQKEIILFEGMKSVLIARDYGFKNTGAILTSHLNPGQMKILARLGVRVVFALDKDVKIKQDRNIEILRRYVNVEYIYDFKDLLDEKDSPVDKGVEVFSKLYETKIKYR